MSLDRPLTGVERFFDVDEIIVSKTDLKGVVTYANAVFCRVAEYRESELLGRPHNIIRHPAMPRCVFKLLWDVIQAGREIFAYVVNRAKSGDHYWVFAHVTPSFDAEGRIVGYHSNRRVPSRAALDQIRPIYADLLRIESRHPTPKQQWQASMSALAQKLAGFGLSYDEFVWSLARPRRQPLSV